MFMFQAKTEGTSYSVYQGTLALEAHGIHGAVIGTDDNIFLFVELEGHNLWSKLVADIAKDICKTFELPEVPVKFINKARPKDTVTMTFTDDNFVY